MKMNLDQVIATYAPALGPVMATYPAGTRVWHRHDKATVTSDPIIVNDGQVLMPIRFYLSGRTRWVLATDLEVFDLTIDYDYDDYDD